jgi:ribosomal protein L44E
VANARILEFYGIHQVMESDVRVAAAQTREQRRHESRKSHERVAPERAEQQVEPHHVRLEPVQRLEEAKDTARVVERPAALNREPSGLGLVWREFVGQNRKVEKRIALQLLCDVKPIFTQSTRTGWERGDQTDLHSSPAL